MTTFLEKYKRSIMKNTKKLFLLFSLSFLFCTLGLSQKEKIKLKNPCFEDYARPGQQPREWYDCGVIIFPLETPPDVHSGQDSMFFFGVTQTAYHGDTYLGMVVRENESFESVAQKLETPLDSGSCYSFSIYLSKSNDYESTILGDDDNLKYFNSPIKLRIWGGNGYCDKGELLAETELIDHTEWKKYSFTFSPNRNIRYFILEAFYQTPTFEIPNGNILLDNASSIVLVDCEEEK